MNCLVEDAVLTQFFNTHLSLPIYPVHVQVTGVAENDLLVSRVDTHSADYILRNDYMLAWLRRLCWPFFLRSQEYCKYRLYCSLHGNSVCTQQISFCKGQEIDEVLLEAVSEYDIMMGSLGQSLVEAWLACEGYRLNIDQDWASPQAITKQCRTIPCLVEAMRIGDTSWIKNAQRRAFDRIKCYWLPRTCQLRTFSPKPHLNRYCFKDGEITILSGLVCNLVAGDAFIYYLEKLESAILYYYKVWKCCHHLTSSSSSQDILLHEGWKLWTQHLDACERVHLSSGLMEKMNSALLSQNTCNISTELQAIKIEVLSVVKRLWSKFQRNLYSVFIRMVKDGISSPNLIACEIEALPPASAAMATGTMEHRSRRRRLDPKIILDSDIEDGALQALGDIQTLFQFEQFLYTCKGAVSEENTCYKLWKVITQYNKTKPWKRDQLAVSIFKTFLSSNSKYQIPDDISDLLDEFPEEINNGHQLRPKSSMLLRIKETAEDCLIPVIKEFLQKEGKVPLDELPVLPVSKKTKAQVVSQLQEDAAHLLDTLTACEGQLSHKLQHFMDYIVRNGSPSFGQVHSNGIQFWLEIQKLKVLYESEANSNIVYHKAEALTDSYLDTSTLPWIKVAVLPEVAVLIVSALGDLFHVRVNAHAERIIDLFEKARATVFKELCSYWSGFCKVYKPPLGEVASLPQLVITSPVVSRLASIQVTRPNIPPLPLLRPNAAPLLSYSKHRGIRWKLPYHM